MDTMDADESYQPYEQVVQATAELMRALADHVAGVESLWVRHEDAHEPRRSGDVDPTNTTDETDAIDATNNPLEVAREWSLVLASGMVLSVRARWYDVNAEGWSDEQELVYDRLDAQDTLDTP